MNKLHLTTRQETDSVTIVQPNVNLRKPIEKKFPGPKILTLIACHTNNVAKVNIIKNNIMYFQALPDNDIVVINSFDSKHHKDIKEYLEKKHPAPQENPYLYSLKILEDIQFKKSISLFHDINTVYFIYYDNSHTKSINNKTKKIYANKAVSNTSHNKTKRKQLKE